MISPPSSFARCRNSNILSPTNPQLTLCPYLLDVMDAAVSLGDPSKALDLANIRFQLMYSHFVPFGRIFPAPL